MVEFKTKEVLMIFAMLLFVTTAVFGLGIFLGQQFENPESKLQTKKDDGFDLLTAAPLEIPTKVSGVTEVVAEVDVAEVEIIKEKPTESKPPLPLAGFTIQVGALETSEDAQRELERIQSIGFPSVFVHEATLSDRRTWYFVDLGYFKERTQAESLANRLLEKGMVSSYLIRRTADPLDETVTDQN